MSGADASLSEALCRLELKVDIILRCLSATSPLAQGIIEAADWQCPVCHEEVKHNVDIVNGIVVRKCGCGTKKIPNMIGGQDGSVQSQKSGPSNSGNGNL